MEIDCSDDPGQNPRHVAKESDDSGDEDRMEESDISGDDDGLEESADSESDGLGEINEDEEEGVVLPTG